MPAGIGESGETSAGLGVAGRDLVRLTHLSGGKRYRSVTGLHHPDSLGLKHIAFNLPSPEAWQSFRARVDEVGLPHHETEEGILLTDPSQNAVLFQKPRLIGAS